MNFGLFFIIPALGGYWILTNLHRTRHQAARGQGYHVLFQAAGVGALVFGISHLVVLLIHCLFPKAATYWQSAIPYAFSDTVALGVLLSLIVPDIGNRIWKEEQSAVEVAEDNGDRIELLLMESIQRQEPVEITLKTRKSYIGRALRGRSVNYSQPDVSLIPVMSGYRNKETLELVLTRNYAQMTSQSNLDYEDFRIVIPKDQIVSVRLFDPDTYQMFQEESQDADALDVPAPSAETPASSARDDGSLT